MKKLTEQDGKSLFPEAFMEDLSASDDGPEISKHYKKIALTIDQQLERLIKQGLLVKNPKRVLHRFYNIGLYF